MNGGRGNLLIVQGGGPTPVLNISLAAAIEAARQSKDVGKILGAEHGMDGLLHGKLVDLRNLSPGAQVNKPSTKYPRRRAGHHTLQAGPR